MTSAGVVVLTGVTVAGGFVAAVLLANDVTGCLGVAVVLVGMGFCTVAGLAAGLGAACDALGATGLAGLGGVLAAGRLLLAGVGEAVVDITLGTAGFSCFTAGGGLSGGTAKVGRKGFESP